MCGQTLLFIVIAKGAITIAISSVTKLDQNSAFSSEQLNACHTTY